jgi:LPS-assembly lipoprotein
MMFKTNSSFIAIFIMSVMLAACGFHLRGLADIPFKTVYVEGNKMPISPDVIRILKTNGVEIIKDKEKAELVVEIMRDTATKKILSLGGGGRNVAGAVREFELVHVLTFRMRTGKSELWDKPRTIENRRDFSYSDPEILAKAYEETMLYENMRQDAVREILRQIEAYRPAVENEDNEVDSQ